MKQSFSIILFLILFAFFSGTVFAQNLSNGTAIGITIDPKESKVIKDGDILSAENNVYKRTTTPYDPNIFGIVSLNPSVYLYDEASPNQIPIIREGEVQIRVSTINGQIKKGDYITSSTIPGVGQKATENGIVVGAAQEDYTEKDPKKIGTITVVLHAHFAQLSNNITRNLLRSVTLGANAALETPLGALRYIIAGVITLLSFFFGFRFFGRASHSGVEAIGRNPLASKTIIISVALNASLTVAIMLFGVAISYLILVL